jgi:uncharacterized membrane protein YgdD (TMEM256/DUF423 family)
MKHTHIIYARLGFLLAAIGVILGAFGSHVLKELMGEAELNTFDIGVRYQMIHAIAIIVLSLNYRKFDETKLQLALGLFFAGILIFSGSLYLLATMSIWGNDSFRVIGAITPLGGVALISAWLILFFKGFAPASKNEEVTSDDKSEHRSGRHRSRSSQSEKPIE